MYQDTKERLIVFFREVHEAIMNEHHQFSLEEYFLKNSKDAENKKLKKVFGRIYQS